MAGLFCGGFVLWRVCVMAWQRCGDNNKCFVVWGWLWWQPVHTLPLVKAGQRTECVFVLLCTRNVQTLLVKCMQSFITVLVLVVDLWWH